MKVPVYTQERRIDTFIYTTGQSALDELSICFWMNGVEDDDAWKNDALISIATPGDIVQDSSQGRRNYLVELKLIFNCTMSN